MFKPLAAGLLACATLASFPAHAADDVIRLGNLKLAHFAAVSYIKEIAPKCGIKVEEKVFAKGLDVMQALDVKVLGRADDLFILEFQEPVLDMLERYGAIPLPPYITHAPDAEDDQRYQTVYARAPGAVAAPTAGLHFDDAMLEQLRQMGVSASLRVVRTSRTASP